MRTEIMVKFTEDIKTKGYPVMYFYPVDILAEKPEKESKLYNTVLERTGSKRIASNVEAWARTANVGDKYRNKHLTASVERW